MKKTTLTEEETLCNHYFGKAAQLVRQTYSSPKELLTYLTDALGTCHQGLLSLEKISKREASDIHFNLVVMIDTVVIHWMTEENESGLIKGFTKLADIIEGGCLKQSIQVIMMGLSKDFSVDAGEIPNWGYEGLSAQLRGLSFLNEISCILQDFWLAYRNLPESSKLQAA